MLYKNDFNVKITSNGSTDNDRFSKLYSADDSHISDNLESMTEAVSNMSSEVSELEHELNALLEEQAALSFRLFNENSNSDLRRDLFETVNEVKAKHSISDSYDLNKLINGSIESRIKNMLRMKFWNLKDSAKSLRIEIDAVQMSVDTLNNLFFEATFDSEFENALFQHGRISQWKTEPNRTQSTDNTSVNHARSGDAKYDGLVKHSYHANGKTFDSSECAACQKIQDQSETGFY